MTDERERDSERQGDLEDRLRGHYRTLGPGSSILLTRRIAELLDRSPRRRPLLHLPTGRWSIARLAAGAAVLVVMALLAAPLLFGPSEPMGGRPTSTTTPSRTPLPIAPTESISPTTMPTPDPSVVLAGARTQALGRMRLGGAFWDQDYTIWRAPDASSTRGDSPWPQSDTTPQAIFVLDRDHIWTITLGPGSSNPYGGQGSGFDHLKAVVNRSAGNGAPQWRLASVPGDYPDSMLSLSFVDELHGFLMASGGPSQFASTILRTDDGGATWSVVATIKTGGVLGGWFTASDDSTLWAGAQAEASSHGHPLLSVSRDGGKTWSEVKLPGMAAYPGGFDAYLDQAPVFLDSRTGFVSCRLRQCRRLGRRRLRHRRRRVDLEPRGGAVEGRLGPALCRLHRRQPLGFLYRLLRRLDVRRRQDLEHDRGRAARIPDRRMATGSSSSSSTR